MTSIVELFPKCRKLAYDARQQVSVLLLLQQQQQQQQHGSYGSKNSYYNNNNNNSNRTASTGDSIDNVQLVLNELQNQLQYMEHNLLHKEIPQQRMIWSRKIQELQSELHILQQQCNSIITATTTTATTQQGRTTDRNSVNSSISESYPNNREELLNLRHRRRQQQPTTNPSDLQQLSMESTSIQSSQNMIQEILVSGEQSYQELKNQRKRLSNITNVLYQISDIMGLSKLTIQIIERRDITDLYYVIIGMIITLIVLYVTWFM